MKPNELRVGNWVIGIEENDYQCTSATITMLERGEGSHIRPGANYTNMDASIKI